MSHPSSAAAPRAAPQASTPAERRRLVTLAEAAELLGLSTCSARRLVWSGCLPVVRLTRRILIDLHDLDRLIDQRKERYPDGT